MWLNLKMSLNQTKLSRPCKTGAAQFLPGTHLWRLWHSPSIWRWRPWFPQHGILNTMIHPPKNRHEHLCSCKTLPGVACSFWAPWWCRKFPAAPWRSAQQSAPAHGPGLGRCGILGAGQFERGNHWDWSCETVKILKYVKPRKVVSLNQQTWGFKRFKHLLATRLGQVS